MGSSTRCRNIPSRNTIHLAATRVRYFIPPANCGWMNPMCSHGNELREHADLALQVAYTNTAEGAAPAEPAVPAEEVQDSLDATV